MNCKWKNVVNKSKNSLPRVSGREAHTTSQPGRRARVPISSSFFPSLLFIFYFRLSCPASGFIYSPGAGTKVRSARETSEREKRTERKRVSEKNCALAKRGNMFKIYNVQRNRRRGKQCIHRVCRNLPPYTPGEIHAK